MDTVENNKKVIVLVEDEEVMVNLLVNKLQKAGYAVKTALDGIAGLDLIREVKPDLVLLDMMLPRLGGFGVLEKLAEEKLIPSLPVVVISNSGQPIEVERALKLGVRDYLIKVNFDPNELLSKVNRIFEMAASHLKKDVSEMDMGSPANVLIIEDDIFLVELLERKFIQEQYKTYRAMDAEQAKTVLSSEPIDIMLLDIVLPGIDGFAFLKELKSSSQWSKIPVVVISNLGQREEIERGLSAGAADYIIKAHATPGEIVAKVRALLNNKQK